MALSIPNRFVNGQTIDAAKFNSNFDSIVSYASTNDTAVAAAQADADTANTIGSGAFCAFATATDQTITAAAAAATLTCADTSTPGFDTDSCFASNTYTAARAGAYSFNWIVRVNAVGEDDTVTLTLVQNSTSYDIGFINGATATTAWTLSGGIVLKLALSDTVVLKAACTNTDVTIDYVYFSGCCVKPD